MTKVTIDRELLETVYTRLQDHLDQRVPTMVALRLVLQADNPSAPAAQSVPEGWREMLEGLQWHYEPYDDHDHRDAGYYCPECCAERKDGHTESCEIRALLAAAPSAPAAQGGG